ncbi:methyltransferase family protein [Chloroflexota bacterium]
MMTTRDRILAYIILAVAGTFAGGSNILFLVFLFTGSLEIVDLGLDEVALLTFDALVALLFFTHHSITIRKCFRARMARFVPPYYQMALFTVMASTFLALLVVLWQPSDDSVLEIGGIFRWIPRAFYFLAIGLTVWTTASLKVKDVLAASDPIIARLRGWNPDQKPFIVAGPYRRVRHPVYLAILLAIWSSPDLSVDRFLFNVLTTIWIIIGTKLEERDMVSDIGEPYRQYQHQVPMLIPYKLRPAARRRTAPHNFKKIASSDASALE